MVEHREINLKSYIRHIPDFPKPGILFHDISTLLRDADGWQIAVSRLVRQLAPLKIDLLAGVESRGFITAAPVADRLGCGFVMLRKKGKLPGKTVSSHYDLEYGSAELEIQEDAVRPGQRVVIMDDLLATGGTIEASAKLLRKMKADIVAASVLIELPFLEGRKNLDVPVKSLMSFDENGK